jgi:arabinogalactan oligomer/maltooligosaccharide transport system permease protein
MLAAFVAVYPVLYIVAISLRPGDALLSRSLALVPDGATLASYRTLLFETPFLRWLANSVLVAVVVTVTGVALASTAGYAVSRFRFRARKSLMSGLLVTQMFPATMLLLPLYIVLIKLGLLNSYLGLVVIYTATALPFCIWQMKGYYDTIPASLEEAAVIDGATPWQTFRKVILPLAAPAMVITALFSFMTAWNEYVIAAVVLQDTELFTLPVGLKLFQSQMNTQWGLYATGSLIVSVPVVVLFLALSRYLISGLTLGAVKG